MKKKTKLILLVAAAAAIGFIGINAYANQTKVAEVRANALAKTDLLKAVIASGKIETNTSENVYSAEAYPVMKIFVKEGGEVKPGDVLAELDMTAVIDEIAQTEINIIKVRNTLSQEQKNINDAVISNKNAAETARIALEKQETSYAYASDSYTSESNAQLIDAKARIAQLQSTLDNEEKELSIRRNEYEKKKTLYAAGTIPKSEVDDYELELLLLDTTHKQTKMDYDNAVINLNTIKTRLEDELNLAKIDLESQRQSYKTALSNLDTAKSKQAVDIGNIDSYEAMLESLKKKLDKNRIIAPVGGTVTKMNAIVGLPPSGILFVIEDLNDLYLNVNVKEFDVGDVAIGQSVVVKSENTGDLEIPGAVTYIGSSAIEKLDIADSSVEFETHIRIDDKTDKLKIGMNARASIELETKNDVYAVSYDALVNKENNETVVYYISESGEVMETPVTTGFETDFNVEIISDVLKDGMMIISDPEGIKLGDKVKVREVS